MLVYIISTKQISIVFTMALRRLERQLKLIEQSHDQSIIVKVDKNNMFSWTAVLIGSPQTPYHGGSFQIEILIPSNYPWKPPNMRFLTKIFHPLIHQSGQICNSKTDCILLDNWNPTTRIYTILQLMKSMMNNFKGPFKICGNQLRQKLIEEKKFHQFFAIASKWTREFAIPKQGIKGQVKQVSNGMKVMPEGVCYCICSQPVKQQQQQMSFKCAHKLHSKCLRESSYQTCPYC